MSELVEGRLVRIEARAFTVEIDGREVTCSLKPKLFTDDRRAKTPVAVGDRVRIRVEGERGVVEEVLPRRNALLRPGGRGKGEVQVTAVNVDQLLIVVATKDPPPRAGLIDRYLIASERNGMDAVLVINKCDQGVTDDLARRARALRGDGVRGLLHQRDRAHGHRRF
jgi:ribosome biogenesis GTPase